MPKTIKNIYDNSVSFENLLKAHKKARCGKREKKKIILFELKLEQELLELEKKMVRTNMVVTQNLKYMSQKKE